MRYLLGFLLLTPMVVGGIQGLTQQEPQKPAPLTAEQQEKQNREFAERIVIGAAKQQVLRNLKDPESARFGDVFIGRNDFVCGMINAKNSFGGYTGEQPFTSGKYFRMGLGSNSVNTYNKYCAGHIESVSK